MYNLNNTVATKTNSAVWSLNALNEIKAKPPEVISMTEDTLALSSAWYRIRKDPLNESKFSNTIVKLVQKELFEEITDDDRMMAERIRDYYSKKIMMWKLLGKPLSMFREDLNTYIHNDPKMIVEKMLPLIYRLPEFYAYDFEFEKMITDHNLNKGRSDSNFFAGPAAKLTPITSFNIKRKLINNVEYWLKDELNYMYCQIVQHNNPLKPLFDKLFSQPHIDFKQVNVSHKSRDDVRFNAIVNFQLI